MERVTFALRIDCDDAESAIAALRRRQAAFASALGNFSLWFMRPYLFGYGECEKYDAQLDAALTDLPEGVTLACAPGSMRLMYHNIGVVRADKSLIRHRVFAARLKPGCEEEYSRRHEALMAARGDELRDGPESNFTIWCGDGHIFGYCELVRAYDHEPTPEERAESAAWETRQLEIMDWLTDDVDWLTGERHPKVRRVI